MLKRIQLTEPDEYFADLGARRSRGVFFYRISGYNRTIHDFILRCYEEARKKGVIIEGKIPNPDQRNLSYYQEIMGMDFRMDPAFINASLKKWLPRMSEEQRGNVSDSIYETLLGLRRAGKNDNMLKNAYIKFMCWLYYRFERIVHCLGDEHPPKILCDGEVGTYELLLLCVLCTAGCDIVLLQYHGDESYRRADPEGLRSDVLRLPDMTAFPPDFSLKTIYQDIRDAQERERLYGPKPEHSACTNAWLSGDIPEDLKKGVSVRGSDAAFFYNCFCRITGVKDKLTYQNELYQLQLELRNSGRRLVIVNGEIAPPTPGEIGQIQRSNYGNITQLISGLMKNFQDTGVQELKRMVNRAFAGILLSESKKEDLNLNRLTGKAVYLICWFRRYQKELFGGFKGTEVSAFFHMGGCRNENEALFLRFLARLPVDVVIFRPNTNKGCCLEDPLLFEEHHPESMNLDRYPEENTGVRVGTAAYHAERELDTLMYQDTGIYRNQQYAKASSVVLQTMYEEIPILWDQELRYRPNFSTVDDVVNMPVIFSKVCGVKDSDLPAYWSSVKKLMTADTAVIREIPHITASAENPVKAHTVEFFRNGRLQKNRIREHKAYQYSVLRPAMQDYLLEKLQLLIDQKLIRGTFENGTEYTIVATALNLDRNTVRMIQKFDFTKKNPKLVYIMTGEAVLSLEDTIYMAFLNLVGFDIVFFVPTGYQCVEQHLNRVLFEEHQIGEYLYDLEIPDFSTVPAVSQNHAKLSWRDRIFKRGG